MSAPSTFTSNLNNLAEHEVRWIEFAPHDATHDSAKKYLMWRQNFQRDMTPITTKAQFDELVLFLYQYRNKIIEPDEKALKYNNAQQKHGISYRPIRTIMDACLKDSKKYFRHNKHALKSNDMQAMLHEFFQRKPDIRIQDISIVPKDPLKLVSVSNYDFVARSVRAYLCEIFRQSGSSVYTISLETLRL